MLSPLQGSFFLLSLTWGDAPGWYLFAPLGRKKRVSFPLLSLRVLLDVGFFPVFPLLVVPPRLRALRASARRLLVVSPCRRASVRSLAVGRSLVPARLDCGPLCLLCALCGRCMRSLASREQLPKNYLNPNTSAMP